MVPLLRFFLFLFLILAPGVVLADDETTTPGIAPKHTIILKDHTPQPEWMQLWERARVYARAGDAVQATQLYAKLLLEKPKIEEALREYVLVLMADRQWKTAGIMVQRLLEENPDSLEYQLYGGRIALALKRYKRASHYFGQVYNMAPGSPGALEALRGQIIALKKQERMELAYPLMEQFYLLVPHDAESIRLLALASLTLGYKDKAEMYYKTLLNEFEATETDFFQSEPLFTGSNDIQMAMLCWQGYLTYNSFYLPFHRKLSTYYLQSDTREKALPHLLVQIAHGDDQATFFLEAGKLYLYEEGRPDKALYYYDEYKKRKPGDTSVESEIKRIQAILANDLLVIVENEGAWNLWRDLAKIVPDRLAVYYSMAKQLEKLDKPQELREVLEIIHLHNPADQDTLFRLAELSFIAGDLTASTLAMDSLEDGRKSGQKYFLLRAELEEQKGYLSTALFYYKSYLTLSPGDYETALHCMPIAGRIGEFEDLRYFFGLITKDSSETRMLKKAAFSYGDILVQNGFYSTARIFYEELAGEWKAADSERMVIYEQIAKILQSEKCYFEAEEQYRTLLLNSNGEKRYITELVQNALLAGDWLNAWQWHEFKVLDSKDLGDDSMVRSDLFLEKLEILSRSGLLDVAIELAEDYLEQYPEEDLLKNRLSELYYQDGDYYNASLVFLAIQDSKTKNAVLQNLLEDHNTITKTNSAGMASDLGLLENALQYEIYGDHTKALEVIDRYLEKYPNSVQGKVLRADLLYASGDEFTTLMLFQEISKKYPGEKYFQVRIQELQFELAKFEQLVINLAPQLYLENKKEELVFEKALHPTIATLTKKQQLLLARSLWAIKRNGDSLRIYSLFLQPPVDQEFSKRLARAEVILQLPPANRSFWNHVTFTSPAEPDRLTVVMRPQFTRDNIGSDTVTIATELYADYRWQHMVATELAVRQDMDDGNYYDAMKEYQKMLYDNPSMESLFDLAGIYSRLGFLGKEAALYEVIQATSPGYPNLDEAMQRNRLKRKPRLAGWYGYDTKDGRDGYYDNRQQAAGLETWFMPSLKHQVTLDYGRIFSESMDGQQELWRDRLQAEMQWSPSYDLDFYLGIGGDRRDKSLGNTFLYDFKINGRLGDIAEGFLSISQDLVDDTLDSLEAGVTNTDYEGGLQLDLLPRLFGGAKYLYREYSDGNHQNKYELWTSYIIHPEPTLLQFRYDYELSHNAETNNPYQEKDHPYWSPKEYWQHLFSISFEHQLAENVLGRGAPSYYTLEYSLGYEEGGYDNHQFNAQIYLEISRHFLLNSSFDYINGSEYEKKDFLLSLIYRW